MFGHDVEAAATTSEDADNQRCATSAEIVFHDLKVDVGGKKILKGVSGFAESGTMVALMGPSGAGKTTLLNVLAGRSVQPSSGSITFNGKPVGKRTKRKISYVLQEDILLAHLTVRETITFTAQLRLPGSMPMKEKLAKVEEVIDALDMRKCADTAIGNPSAPGVSGGEKKRTSIACELLTNPALLMLDEPTTGLDSSTAYSLIKVLKKHMKESGKLVIASIHQPSSQTFFLFDKVLLLSDGQVAYFGPCSDMLGYFESLGIYNRPNFNPADFMLETVDKESTKQVVMSFATKFESRLQELPQHRRSIEGSQGTDSNNDIHHNASSSFNGLHRLSSSPFEDPYFLENARKWPTGFGTQTAVLTRRNFKEALPRILSWRTGMETVIVSLFYGLLAFQLQLTEEAVSDRLGVLFFFNTNWAFRCGYETLLSMAADMRILKKERASGYYRLSAFYCAKMASEFPLTLLLPTAFISVIYWMTGLSGHLSFFKCYGHLLLSCLSAQSIGLLIGVSIGKPHVASAVINVIIQTSMIVGGYYVRTLPPWIDWIKYLSHIRYSFNGMIQAEFSDGYYRCMPQSSTAYCSSLYEASFNVSTGIKHNLTDAPTFPGNYVMQEMNAGWPEGFYACMLLLLSAVYRLAAYMVLRFAKAPE